MTDRAYKVFVESEREQLQANAANSWFVDEYWPANRPRLIAMLAAAVRYNPPAPGKTLADIGCGTGYMCEVFAKIGYTVTGVDGYADERREGVFAKSGIAYGNANFNADRALQILPDAFFDVVLCGEVIEHILHHPQGFCDELCRILKPGGIAIVSTPNPCTLMNAIRVVRGRHSLWGTPEFIALRKYENGQPISHGGIHYREYTPAELAEMLGRSGLRPLEQSFLGAGSNRLDGWVKRFFKATPLASAIQKTRLFGAGQCYVGSKRD